MTDHASPSRVAHSATTRAGVTVGERLLALITAALLGVDAYVHLHDAAKYDGFKSSVMTEGTLFRIQAVVAIVVGLLAVVLFSSAALTVDLGNAWARKRDVQKQVDVAALSVGWMLPMTSANKLDIANGVAGYLNAGANAVAGQKSVTGAQLVDGNLANGEVLFQHSDGTGCTDKCPQLRVLAPPAQVTFGLAAAIGFRQVAVQRDATVRVVSGLPPRDKTIPFWLPTGCGYGPTQGDTTQGGTNQATASPTATATSPATVTASPTPYAPSPK